MPVIRSSLPLMFVAFAVSSSMPSLAWAQDPIPYGSPITLEAAHKAVTAAEAEAKKQSWPVAIAVVDASGYLVAFHRLDNTQLGSIEVALQKAKSAALFRRPTKVFEEALEKGGANFARS